MSGPEYYIGVISGTSTDAVDCGLLEFTEQGPVLAASLSYPYEPALRQRILTLCAEKAGELALLGETDIAIGRTFAAAVLSLLQRENLAPAAIRGIGSHGQTIFHHPQSSHPFSTQLGDPNTIAALTGITTVADFRRMDMAVGGQGAPLAPLFHQYLFRSDTADRVIVNIGGIANISILARHRPFLGFDTGPGNVLMDHWTWETRQQAYDEGGRFAASGHVHQSLLELLLQEPYFGLPAPKSTGRELFNRRWLLGALSRLPNQPPPADIQATLLELTARTIHQATAGILAPDSVYICGGGAYNTRLMERLTELFAPAEVNSTAALGLAPDWVEAATFAWLARQRLEGIPVDARSVTGASRPCRLGGIYLP